MMITRQLIIHNYLSMLINYMLINDLDMYISKTIFEYLCNNSVKVSVEYIQELLNFHKMNNSNSDAIAKDVLDLMK
jgi:hypothetical protein